MTEVSRSAGIGENATWHAGLTIAAKMAGWYAAESGIVVRPRMTGKGLGERPVALRDTTQICRSEVHPGYAVDCGKSRRGVVS